jgi:tetratricopeptide (TPR) repeat protein
MPLPLTVLRVLTTALLLSPIAPAALIAVAPRPAIAQTAQSAKVEADRLLQAGIQAYQAGKTTEALATFQQALLLFRQIGDRVNEWRSLGWMGGIYNRLGQLPKALELQQQALSITQQIGDRSGTGNSLNNIGFIYDRLGQYAKALEFYQQALAISQEIGDRAGSVWHRGS